MKLKVKNLNWQAGRPVVFLDKKAAKSLNVSVNDRVLITNEKRVYAVVDIFSEIMKQDEIGLSRELTSILKSKEGEELEVRASEVSNATYIINKKVSGKELSKEELEFLISEIVHNNLTEAEIAYFTSAEKLEGMDMKEIIDLTRAMIKTGAKLKFNGKYIADKHSIGGIAGNRTTPLVISICASLGLVMPKTSSKAITSAAGTADVIETIANVELSLEDIKRVVKKTNACLAWGGSLGLAPSDDKIIRVERMLNLDADPQLLASIMSKKIAAGSKYILIDIPYGDEAKVNSIIKAKRLGNKFKIIAKAFKVKVRVVYTKSNGPIGNGIGPNLEMLDVLSVLKNLDGAPKDLREKAIYLSTELLNLCRIKDAKKKAEDILFSGKAYNKFKEIINAQNKSNDFEKRIKKLKLASNQEVLKAPKSGVISKIGNKEINSLCRILGTPETESAGIYLHKHAGDKVAKGEPIFTMYSESLTKLDDAKDFIKQFEPVEIKNFTH